MEIAMLMISEYVVESLISGKESLHDDSRADFIDDKPIIILIFACIVVAFVGALDAIAVATWVDCPPQRLPTAQGAGR
jgi:hypothetical protein